MLNKNRKLVRFEKLIPELQKKLMQSYPRGFEEAAIRIDAPTPFYAVLFEEQDVSYLVRLNNYQIKTSSLDYDDDDDDNDDDNDDVVMDSDEDFDDE